jgi:hypothetical protein
MTQEDLLKLELHQEAEVHELLSILRVPGGWIYKFFRKEYTDESGEFRRYILENSTFVPEPFKYNSF